MADQTTLTRPSRQFDVQAPGSTNDAPCPEPAAAKGVYRNMAHFGHDLVNLTELQAKLFVVDLKEVKSSAIKWGLGAAAALVLLLACLPVGMLALGWVLVEFAGWSRSASFAVAGLAGIIIGALTLWLSGRQLRKSFNVLKRSKDEFVNNFEWIKSVLKAGGGVRRP